MNGPCPVFLNLEAIGYFLGKEWLEEVSTLTTLDTATVGTYARVYIWTNYQGIYKDSCKRTHAPSSSKYAVTRPVEPHRYEGLELTCAHAPLYKHTLIDALTRSTVRTLVDLGLSDGNKIERTPTDSRPG